MLKAIAIDDEPIALEVIRELTAKVTFVEVLGYFTSALDAVEFLKPNTIDLIFLDIKMPDMTGFEFLRAMPSPPMIIFTTAYSEYAVEGFEENAIDYVLKPFSLSRFLKACNKAYEHYGLRMNMHKSYDGQGFAFIKSGYENVRVEFKEVLYAEALGNYVQLVMADRKIITRLTMGEAETLLSARGFLRIHRSYIVSKSKILKLDKKNLWLSQTELPIGPLYLPDIEKAIIHST